MILMPTSSEQMTKYPAHSALVKVRKRKTFGQQLQAKKYSQTPLYRHPLIWTTYYRQSGLSLGKESCYIFSKFNPLNTDIPSIGTLSTAPPVSVIYGFSQG